MILHEGSSLGSVAVLLRECGILHYLTSEKQSYVPKTVGLPRNGWFSEKPLFVETRECCAEIYIQLIGSQFSDGQLILSFHYDNHKLLVGSCCLEHRRVSLFSMAHILTSRIVTKLSGRLHLYVETDFLVLFRYTGH